MTLKTCFRCDWQGETKKPSCPNCGTQSLYVVGVSPPRTEAALGKDDPAERSREASIAAASPSGTPTPPATPTPPTGDAIEPTGRSPRSTLAYVLAALILIVVLGAWLNRRGEPSPGPAAATSDSPSSTAAPSSSQSAALGSTGVLRRDGEVLTTQGRDLVAVEPATGESRTLLDLGAGADPPTAVGGEVTRGRITYAAWSPDGRWVAFDGPDDALWVMNAKMDIRWLASHVYGDWVWSPTEAQLAMILNESTLTVVDASTGQMTTDLGAATGDVTSAPVWSPDGTRIVFGARGGSLYSVNVQSAERSLLVHLPGENLDSIDEIEWSPDGAHLVVMNDLEPGGGRLYVMNADGSDVRILLDNYMPGGLAWSPDGESIAYVSYGAANRLRTISPIEGPSFTVAASTSIGDPVWSPDGSRIGFVGSTRPGSSGWFAVDADGAGQPREIDELTYLSWQGGSVFPSH